MRKAAVLFLVGLSPFLLGWLLSLGMTTIFAQMGLVLHRGRSGRADAVDGGLRHVWLQGLQVGHGAHHAVHQPSSAGGAGAAGVQELSLHAYWDNAVGLLTQFFYLPLLRLGAIVAMWTGQVFWFYFGAFLLLVLSSWLGCRAKDPVKK